MALLFWDSFDHYATADLLYKWTSSFQSPSIGSFGRNSTNGLRITPPGGQLSYVRRALPTTPDTVVMGFALYYPGMPTTDAVICEFLDGTTIQIQLRLNNDGSLDAYRGNASALLGSSAPGTIDPAVYHYVEIKALIDNAAGTVEVRVDDESTPSAIDVSGVDTRASSNDQVTQVQLGGVAANVGETRDYDDLYVCDDTGAQCNDFLGDTRVIALFPDADATHSDFTPLVGPGNYQDVDEVAPDDDTTYNSSATATDRDSFDFDDLPGGIAGNVHAACATICSRKDDAGVRTLDPSVRVGGTDYDGTGVNIPSSYAYHNLYAWELNPDIAAVWTVATINALEAGYELSA
jgi:hypothetical protein